MDFDRKIEFDKIKKFILAKRDIYKIEDIMIKMIGWRNPDLQTLINEIQAEDESAVF